MYGKQAFIFDVIKCESASGEVAQYFLYKIDVIKERYFACVTPNACTILKMYENNDVDV